ncbi:MAG TPA: metalloregulator ArsR/SmtB family transcription factor [Elusimicrobiales bacterium]|nr:metalloregulator ArsR/SmtB family transcription factor [Elusimicrobiales bacterium]
MKNCRDIKVSVKALKALAEGKRLRVAALLAYAGRALCVCELTDATNESQYNISRCLGALCAAGLVKKEKSGRWAMYSLTSKAGPLGEYVRRLVKPKPCCPVVAADIARLKKRLGLRRKGVCVIGCKC